MAQVSIQPRDLDNIKVILTIRTYVLRVSNSALCSYRFNMILTLNRDYFSKQVVNKFVFVIKTCCVLRYGLNS
jgi:hypothetical protein